MNELIAQAMADRFTDLKTQGLLTTVVGLVRTKDTDAFAEDKTLRTLPVPYADDSRTPDDWKLPLPDPAKAAILYFEDGGFVTKRIGSLDQVKSRVTLVCWFNGNQIAGITRQRLQPILLNALVGNTKRILTTNPTLPAIQVAGYTSLTQDPFAKYSAWQALFNFRNAPYGWLALDFSLTAYVSVACEI